MCRNPAVKTPELKEDEAWIEKFDVNAFAADITALGKKLEQEQGPADVKHLQRMVMWSNMCAATGLLTMGYSVNIVSIIGLSLFTFSRWTMIAHHTCTLNCDAVLCCLHACCFSKEQVAIYVCP